MEVKNSTSCTVSFNNRKYFLRCDSNSWNDFKIKRSNDNTLNVYLNKQSVEIYDDIIGRNIRNQTLYFGGLGDIRNPLFQYLGKMKNIIINDNEISYNSLQLVSSDFPVEDIKLSCIKVNNTIVKIPIGFIKSDKISLHLEFRTPETFVRIVSLTFKRYYLNLTKVNNQLRLRYNLRGYNERLIVELIQDSQWIPVTVVKHFSSYQYFHN